MDSQRAFREGRYAANINILVVDDDITSLNIVSAMLKTWSYQVMTVRSPIDALAVLRKGKCTFDLVVTDLHMPQMNGLELQKVVREEFELPVIMMSADDKESVILKSLEGGVVYYIVKPVSKDDISMLWQYVVQHRKKKFSNVTIEDIGQGTPGESAPAGQQLLQGPGELDDLDCVTSLADDANRKDERKSDHPAAGRKKMRKRDRDDDQEKVEGGKDRRLLAPKKAKVVWSNSLHNQFLMAIRHIGLYKAVPKRILEVMNVSGLTRENVASHLQKYRMFLRRVAEKARLSKCLSERVFRSSIAFGLPSRPSFNHVQREQYAEYLKQQLQMNDMGLTQQPLQNALAAPPLQNTIAPPLGTAFHLGSSSLGQLQPNCNQQQPATLNLAGSSNSITSSHQYHQLFGSGQSRLLMNNTTPQQQQRPIQLAGNRMNQFSSQANCGSGYEMQMVNNNVGNLGGYGGGLIIMDNNGGNGLVNSGTNWMDVYSKQTQAKQLQQALSFTSNPFNFRAAATPGFSSPSIPNMVNTPFNNEDVGSSFGGGTSQRASATGGINSFMIGGHNGMVIKNEVINGLSTGVQRVNLNGTGNHNNATSLVTTTTGNYASSARFGTNSANQLVSILPKNKQHGMSSTVDDFSYSTVMKNAARNFNSISLTGGDEDIMAINNFVLQQLDNETLPRQEQGEEDDIVTFNSMLYQDEDRVPALARSSVTAQVQPNTIRAVNGQVQLNPTIDELQLNPAPTPIYNFQVPLNLSPVVNDQATTLEANPVAGTGQPELHPIGNQVGNPNIRSTAAYSQLVELNHTGNQVGYPNFASGPYPIEYGVNEENFWNQLEEEQGGDTQMFDFQSEDDFSCLLDQFTTQDADDDFLNALMSF